MAEVTQRDFGGCYVTRNHTAFALREAVSCVKRQTTLSGRAKGKSQRRESACWPPAPALPAEVAGPAVTKPLGVQPSRVFKCLHPPLCLTPITGDTRQEPSGKLVNPRTAERWYKVVFKPIHSVSVCGTETGSWELRFVQCTDLKPLVLLHKGESSAYDKLKVWYRLNMTKMSNRSTPYAVIGRKNSGEGHSTIYQMNVWHLWAISSTAMKVGQLNRYLGWRTK